MGASVILIGGARDGYLRRLPRSAPIRPRATSLAAVRATCLTIVFWVMASNAVGSGFLRRPWAPRNLAAGGRCGRRA